MQVFGLEPEREALGLQVRQEDVVPPEHVKHVASHNKQFAAVVLGYALEMQTHEFGEPPAS
jgi:hypothetical protein